ncbi:MAG TPA: copper resistance CopC family protein [Nonomuraea sp.]|nr:copper resistance CopC family protein [Nonomuraea sp.]
MSYGPGRLAGAVRLITGALVSAVFLAVTAMPAAAHTALKASSPQHGGQIPVAPSQLVLEFTGPIVDFGYQVSVRGPDGREYHAGTPRVSRTTLTQSLQPLGPPGEYQVTFRIVAEDGHPLVSGIRFMLTKPGPAAGGRAAMADAGPLTAVPPTSLANPGNNAPAWAPWMGGAFALLLVLAAVLFGRRVIRGIDQ